MAFLPFVGALKVVARKGDEVVEAGVEVADGTSRKQAMKSSAAQRPNKAVPEGVVYKRTDPLSRDSYVGQSMSSKRYIERQKEHNRGLGIEHEYEILGRAEPGKGLDVLEEDMMRTLGGIEREGGTLKNRRHQMREQRYRDAGGKH
jgi:hypothetical protein